MDKAFGIAVDSQFSAYLTGVTFSDNFPLENPYQATLSGLPGPAGTNEGVFVSKLNLNGSALVYSTYLGGGALSTPGADRGYGIAVDSTGAAYVAGLTFSGNFPLVNSLLAPAGGFYPYLTKLNPAGSELFYSSLLGIGGSASGVAVDTSGNAYVTGTVTNGGFPVTTGAAETSLPAGAGSVFTAFVVKIGGPPGTVTGVRSSANPSVFGQQATFTATVTPSVANSNTPTGAVIFADGATTLGAINLSSGTATFSTTGLSVGSHSITASYFGDSNFAGSVSTTLTQVVSQAATATGLRSSLNPANAGQTVTLTATIAPVAPGAGTPTGTVTFLDAAGSPAGTAPVNSGVATLVISTLSLGGHTISASYGGDANFAASASAAFTQTIVAPQPLSIVVVEGIKVTDTPVPMEGLLLAIIVHRGHQGRRHTCPDGRPGTPGDHSHRGRQGHRYACSERQARRPRQSSLRRPSRSSIRRFRRQARRPWQSLLTRPSRSWIRLSC